MAINFNDEQATALLGPLGLPVDITDPNAVVATVVDALSADNLANAAPSAILAAVKSAGLGEVVEADVLAALRHDAAEGRQIKATVARERIEGTVENAIKKGKITPARREHWVNLITADPAMAEVLNNTPDETAVPLTAIGHSIGNEGGGAPDAAYDW